MEILDGQRDRTVIAIERRAIDERGIEVLSAETGVNAIKVPNGGTDGIAIAIVSVSVIETMIDVNGGGMMTGTIGGERIEMTAERMTGEEMMIGGGISTRMTGVAIEETIDATRGTSLDAESSLIYAIKLFDGFFDAYGSSLEPGTQRANS